MRIVFMGTPDFAAAALDALYAAGHEVCAVFTQPDKPKNRGHKLTPGPVKLLAQAHGTPVFQPVGLRDGEALSILREIAPDLIAVVAYGKLLPVEILNLPPQGCINIHGSLLPKYRGSAPIQHAILNNESVTGVTAMYMAEEMDAGDIIAMRETEILPNETSGALFARLAVIGAALLCETVAAISGGTASRTPQNHTQATYAPPLQKSDAPVDWNRPAPLVCAHIHGMNPWPVATAQFGDTVFKLYTAEVAEGEWAPGTVLRTGEAGLEVACASGSVLIKELQVAGGKRMRAADYLRGHSI